MRFNPVFIIYVLIISLFISTVSVPGDEQEPYNGTNDDSWMPHRSIPVDEGSWPMLLGDPAHNGYSGSSIPLENTTDILWGQRITNLMSSASPVVEGRVVYIGSGNGYMKGFDIDTGEEVWDAYIGNQRIRAAASISGGRIFFGADNGHLYGYEISTKTRFLDIDLGGFEIESSPLVIGDRAYIGVLGPFLKNHKFHAVDISSGSINWTLSMGDQENFYGFKETAAYGNGWIYIGDGNGTFYCLDPEGMWNGNDGTYTNETDTSSNAADIIWMRTSPNSVMSDALLAEGNVYYTDDAGRLICLNATTGEEIWTRILGRGEQSLQASPTYKDGRIYLAARYSVGVYDGASVYSLDPSTGSQIWRFNITGQVITQSSPVIAGDHLVFGSRNGKVYCISTIEENIADEDRIEWAISTGSPVSSTPAIANGRVFVSNEQLGNHGRLFAIGAPDPSIRKLWLSDPAPYEGESVKMIAELWNNATVDAYCDITFIISTFNNSRQSVVGTLEGKYVPAGESTIAEMNWVAKVGYDLMAVIIQDSTPKDRNNLNNLGTDNLNVKIPLSTGWTSAGSGPGRTSGSGRGLESNRSFWEIDLAKSWSGSSGSLWYDGISGNGSLSSSGAAVYMVDPSGDLVSINSTPEESGKPGYLWKYANSSVDFMGKPVLLIEKDRSLNGPNKVFAYGDDGAIWAFDWIGFRDGLNDGEFRMETSTTDMDGDVIWRTEMSVPPSGPMLVCAGKLIVPGKDGRIRGVDDDDGSLTWTRDLPGIGMTGDSSYLYVANENEIHVLDPNSGETIHKMIFEAVPFDVNIRSLALTVEGILATTENGTILMEEYPLDDTDDGILDNSTSSDTLWYRFFENDLISPPTIAPDGSSLSAATANMVLFINIKNGTDIASISLTEPLFNRMVSGGANYYMITGSDPWVLSAYSPNMRGNIVLTWTLELDSEPMDEMVTVGNHMYLVLRDGRLISLGADNNKPLAVIDSPDEGILVFPGESFILDASGSSDPDDDPLNYVWFIEGEEDLLFEGTDITAEISLDSVGKKRLVLRAYDDMGAYGETSINITVLKRVTGPDFSDELYGIGIHMSYGISEASGRGIISATIPEEIPEAPGSVFTFQLDFDPWPVYADYRFEWANVTIDYSDKEFKQVINKEKMGVFFYDEGRDIWIKAPATGITNDSMAFGNFTDLKSGIYSIGILDNNPPELRHREIENYRYRQMESIDFRFRVEYRDDDNDLPVMIKLMIDNNTEYEMIDEGFATSVRRWTFFSADDVRLEPGQHSYFFIVDDGYFRVRSEYFHYYVGNTPPVARITGPTSYVEAGNVVLFDGSGSYDLDGDEITWSWDFNENDGIQKDKVGPKVDHIFIEQGNYIVTLTVSDGIDRTQKTLSVTVMDPEDSDGDTISAAVWILIMAIIGALILAIIVFIVISKKGHEEETSLRKEYGDRWTCPECGKRIPSGIEECSNCDYIHDPLDFEDEDDLEIIEEYDEM